MKWKNVSTTILFLMLIAMPILGLQMVSAAQDSESLSIGSWWTIKSTYRQVSTGSGSWEGTYTETGEYTMKILVTNKNSDTMTLSNQEDGKWSCTATGNWWCTSTGAQETSDTWSDTYEYTIALNTLKVIDVGRDQAKDFVGHPTWYMVNVGQLTEGGKAVHHWWVPNSNAKGNKIADVDFSVDTQTAKIKGAQLKVWGLSYSGGILGWERNDNGVYSSGPATTTYLYDPVYGIWVGYSDKSTTNGVAAGGDGSWTEVYSEDGQLIDTNLSFAVPVTLNAEPSGHVAVTVDSVEYGPDQLPTVFDWAIGDMHTLEVSPTVEGATGVRYVFVQWSDGSKDTSRTLTATEEVSLTATFKIQYELTVTSDFGNPQGSGWYDANTQATFSITTPVTAEGLMGALGGMQILDHWSGDTTAATPLVSVTMDRPKTVKAEWRTDNMMPYTIIGAMTCVIAVAVAALLIVRRKAGTPKSTATVTPPARAAPPVSAPPPSASNKFCINCGSQIPQTAKFCAMCGSQQ
jgi:hypothetical protein